MQNSLQNIKSILSNNFTSLGNVIASTKISSDRLNAELVLEMAKTASVLSNQLLQLHKNLSLNSTPKNQYHCQILTPLSSGYNSVRSSCESLAFPSVNLKRTHKNVSFGDSTSTDLDSSTNSSFNSTSSKRSCCHNLSDTEALSIRKCLFQDHQQLSYSHAHLAQTPFKSEAPVLPRIKEVRRDICKKKTKNFFFAKKRSSAYRNLSFSSTDEKI